MPQIRHALAVATLAISATVAAPVHAQAIRNAASFTGNTLPANDDASTGLVNLGFNANYFGTTYAQTYVNNNGNLTFNNPLGTYTPFALTAAGTVPIIAAFFADVDTRGPGSGLTQYGTAFIGGRNVFGVNWIDVGYYFARVDKLNSFQMILTSRVDTGAGNFDIEFNYNRMLWETGESSGGTSAAAGFAAANGVDFYQLPGSLVNGALIDGGPNALISASLNSNVLGRYIFEVRNGTIITPPVSQIPVPGALPMLLSGLALAGLFLRRRKTA